MFAVHQAAIQSFWLIQIAGHREPHCCTYIATSFRLDVGISMRSLMFTITEHAELLLTCAIGAIVHQPKLDF